MDNKIKIIAFKCKTCNEKIEQGKCGKHREKQITKSLVILEVQNE